jgi:hypothetical protein
MAQPTVRAFAIYINDKKTATVNQQSASFMGGRTPVMGSEGYLAHSKGAIQTKLTLNDIVPISGSDLQALEQKFLNQENVEIAMFIGGTVKRVEMAIVSLEFGSTTETGVASGTGQFEGGVPKIV